MSSNLYEPQPPLEIVCAHSPDSDDAFMFYGLATNKVRVPGLKFSHTLCDIETLNRKAMDGEGFYDVTAISFHAYPYIQEHYALLTSGGSGVTPYRSMMRYIMQKNLPTRVVNLYSVRLPEEIIFDAEFRALCAANPNFKHFVTCTRVPPEDTSWTGLRPAP